MKKIIALLLSLSLTISLHVFSQSGRVFDDLAINSKILKGERNFAIYLPPDYEASQRHYPILYLLHGAGDDHTGWVQFGEVLHIADKAIKEGKITPMIIVMPDAKSGRLGYFNNARGDWRYEDFFFQELMPYVEKKYRVRGEKQFRAISGLSMGGGGTFMYALHHPELFSSACPMSAYTGPRTIADFKKGRLKDNDINPDSVIEAYIKKHDAIYLIENLPEDQKKAVRWYIDCGDDDFLYEGNSLVHIAMRKREIPHEFRVREGGHNWSYWRDSLVEVLKFVSDGFHQY